MNTDNTNIRSEKVRPPKSAYPAPTKTDTKVAPTRKPTNRLAKTALCKNFEAGECKYGDRCTFAHGKGELQTKPVVPNSKPANRLAKTVLCKNFEAGECKYGNRCTFAHGKGELQTTPKRKPVNPLFKTVLCENFKRDGKCKYGKHCNFAHDNDELRNAHPYRKMQQQKPTINKVNKIKTDFEYKETEFPPLPAAEVIEHVQKMSADVQEFVPEGIMSADAAEFVPGMSADAPAFVPVLTDTPIYKL